MKWGGSGKLVKMTSMIRLANEGNTADRSNRGKCEISAGPMSQFSLVDQPRQRERLVEFGSR